MDNFWNWANQHYFLTALLAYCVLLSTEFVSTQIFRTVKVLLRCWPSNPNMDADGDLIFEKTNQDGKLE